MKRALALAAALALLAGAAHAQTPAPSDPAKLALAHKVIETQGGDAGMRRQMEAVLGSMNQATLANLPPDAQKYAGPLQESITKAVLAMVPDIIVATEHAWADNLSEQELRDYAAFLGSPSGHAITEKMPVVMNQMMKTTMPMVASRMPVVMRDAARAMCEQQHCTPAEQQQVIAAVGRATPQPKG